VLESGVRTGAEEDLGLSLLPDDPENPDDPDSPGHPHQTRDELTAQETAAPRADAKLPASSEPSPLAPTPAPRRRRWRRWRQWLGQRVPVLVAVALGGVLGGCARYGVDLLVPASAGFPWATFAVNVTGAACLGLLLVLVLEVWRPTRYVRPFLGVGLLGSMTTFSTWMVETDQLVASGAPLVATAYLLASLAAGLAATVLGMTAGRLVIRRDPGPQRSRRRAQ
jgi:fluoride exporter